MARVRFDLEEFLTGRETLTPELFEDLVARSGLTRPYLRKRLIALGHPLHPLVEGVRQDSAHHIERTLSALAGLYPNSPAAARQTVLEARNRAGFAARKNPADPWRREVLLHLRTWLENPEIYPSWLAVKNRKPPAEAASGFSVKD